MAPAMASALAFAFWGTAAAAQLALAVPLWLRRREEAWRTPASIQLAVNGAAAALELAEMAHGGRLLAVPAHYRLHEGLDTLTASLVLWTALSFPRPAGRWAGPVAVAALCLLPAAAYAAAWLAGVPLGIAHSPQGPASWLGTLLVRAFPVAAWAVLLARWARWLARAPAAGSALPLFGAYAVRAAHMGLLIPSLAAVRWDGQAASAPFLALVAPVLLAHAAALAYAIAVLARRAFRPAGGAALCALGFLAAGCLEALLSLGPALVRDFPNSPLANLDVLVLRPLLLGVALFAGTRLLAPRPYRLTLAAAGLVGTLSLAAGFEVALPAAVSGPARAGLSLAAAVVAALGLCALLAPVLRRTEADPAAVDAYLQEAEDAIAAGTPDAQRRLEEAAARLGIPPAQASALRAAARSGWSGRQPWSPGQRLRRHRLERLLGQGSWGETWLARSESGPVVLKRTGRLGPAARQVLLAEAEALRAVRHPNVVRLLGIERAGAEPVLEMEHAAGGSLEAVLRRGPVAPAEVERLLRGTLAGLQAIHDAGLVHGDVKPANILLSGAGDAVVADLGCARPAPVAGETMAPGQPATLLYQAPEQARSGRCDARSDQYGAALVGLCLLWGRAPDAVPVRSGAFAFPPGTPAPLRSALRRALGPDPRRRFPGCAAFARALSAKQQQGAAHPKDVASLQGA